MTEIVNVTPGDITTSYLVEWPDGKSASVIDMYSEAADYHSFEVTPLKGGLSKVDEQRAIDSIQRFIGVK